MLRVGLFFALKYLADGFSLNLTLVALKGISKNSNFCVRARKHRPESRSLRGVNEDSRTELTPLSRKKCIFRDAPYNTLKTKLNKPKLPTAQRRLKILNRL